MFKNWRQKRQKTDRIVLAYIKSKPGELLGLGCSIGVGNLYSSLKRLRQQGLIDSVSGEAIAGGARRQYYFASTPLERFELS